MGKRLVEFREKEILFKDGALKIGAERRDGWL